MQIAHLWPCRDSSKNIGDHFVQYGIRKLLAEQIGAAKFTDIPVRLHAGNDGPFGITRNSVALINQHDLLVIGGSNLYEPVEMGWGVDAEDDAIRDITCPVLLMGIGTGWSFAFPRFPELSPAAANQLALLHKKAIGSSVRDDMSQRLLTRIGVERSVVTGCPAMFIGGESLRAPTGNIVGVPFLPRRMHPRPVRSLRTLRSMTERRRRMAGTLFSQLIQRIRSRGWTPRILVQDSADVDMASKGYDADVVYFDNAADMLMAIASCDVIVGFRLHACIAGLGFGIPVIPVLLDGRCHAFTETLAMSEFAIPLEPDATKTAIERIEMAFDERRRYWSAPLRLRDELAVVMRRFVESTKASLSSHAHSQRELGPAQVN